MIVVCGEALIDFLPVKDAHNRELYRPVVGGSPFNTAIGIGRLAGSVGFCAALSKDFFGDKLANALKSANVCMTYVARSHHSSMLAFVSVGEGEPEYAFVDEASANRLFQPEQQVPALGPDCSMIWTGSVALINEPIASAYEKLFFENKGRRVLGIDPNVRPTVITDPSSYRSRMARMLQAANIIKISRVDLQWLYPEAAPGDWAQKLVSNSANLVVITDGSNGAKGYGKGFTVESPAVRVAHVADTVGAGDSYSSGLLTILQRRNCVSLDSVTAINRQIAREAMDFAARAASVTVSREGADPPWNHEMD